MSWGTHPVRTYWPYENDKEFRENQPWLYLATIEHSNTPWHVSAYEKQSIRICKEHLEKYGYAVIAPEETPVEPTSKDWRGSY